MLKQKTLRGSFSLNGKGLHTGVNLTVTFNPAPDNHGYKIQRIDLEGQPIIDAVAENVGDTTRGTVLIKNGIKVSTVEHALAALYAAGIDNCLIQVNGPEFPILDGSAKQYVECIQRVGIEEQNAVKDYYIIKSKIEFRDEASGSSIIVLPDENFSVNVLISYQSKILSNQFATLEDMSKFPTEVASARTFVFVREIEPLLGAGLIKGGDLDNAIVIVERDIDPEELEHLSKLCNKKDVKVTKGYLNNLKLRFPNECARHKLLDMLGDLALIGVRIRGSIVANKPGHFANTEFAKLVRKNIKRDSVRPTYRYNPNVAPEYDINQIRALLPHRPPFLLVDKVLHVDSEHVIGIKNVTMNEPFFVGHFPQEPVMPGVLIIEAMAQCGGILALHDVPDPEHYSTYFMKIDGVKFRGKVVPGDTLQFELRLVEPIRRGIVMMEAKAFVGDQLKTEALMMAQVIRNKA